MKFDELVALAGNEPVFETGLLLAGNVDRADVYKQLARWTQTGRVQQLRRGLYGLAPLYRKVEPHPFLVANRLAPGSYVSLQAALAYYNLIPETVPVITSVGNLRPGQWHTPLGVFTVRHIRPTLLWGYQQTQLPGGQQAFVATPEKALLDLLYLEPHSATPAFIAELRLQYLERLDLERLRTFAGRTRSAKLQAASAIIDELARQEAEYEVL